MKVSPVERVLRELAPQVLAVLARRYERFDLCEDAVQEALLAAATRWPVDGLPDNPKGWLITTASRRWIEAYRQDVARRRREDAVAIADVPGSPVQHDDSLALLFLCCHPVLTRASQIALTLRAVGGLTTAEIARALLVPEPTVAQRISRAKARIRECGARFSLPALEEFADRLAAVQHVLYLIFNEGYTASAGASLHRVDLTREATRLARLLHAQLPDDGETAGLLALMLLTDARRPARTRADATLVPLPEQDRALWNRADIDEGTALLARYLPRAELGPYQVQAAIAAVHDEAATADETDWPQILGLYDVLTTIAPGAMVTLNRLVALAMVRGTTAGLAALDEAAADPALAGHHRLASVRAHLLDLAGDHDAASVEYARAARATQNLAERRYLERRALRQPST